MIKNSIKYILQKILGFKSYLYIFSLFIIKKLPWDRKEKDFLYFIKMIPNKGLLLDIGANIGVMSYYLAKEKPKAKIIAFEPIKINYDNLEKIVRKYKLKNIEIYKCALGIEDGEIDMVMPVINSVKLHGLSHIIHDSIKEYNEGDTFKVPIKKLDKVEILQELTAHITGIKIDIENFEYYALKGGQELIKKHKPIIYAELWDGKNRELTFNLLSKLDYSINIVDNGQLVTFNKQNKQNFIFVPKQKV